MRTGKLLYEFTSCTPETYQYCIEFVGQKSKENRIAHHNFLEELGYRVLSKNINLNVSTGKLRLRPWAKTRGRIAANSTTFHRALLIIKKRNDGKAFHLHTTCQDSIHYYQNLQNPWLCLFLMSVLFSIITWTMVSLPAMLLTFLPVILYQRNIMQIKKKANIYDA